MKVGPRKPCSQNSVSPSQSCQLLRAGAWHELVANVPRHERQTINFIERFHNNITLD